MGLGREERGEDAITVLGVDSCPGILDLNYDIVRVEGLRFNRQQVLILRYARHRLERVVEQIEQNLLQLNSVGGDFRKSIRQLQAQSDMLAFTLRLDQCQHIADQIVDGEAVLVAPIPPEYRPDA